MSPPASRSTPAPSPTCHRQGSWRLAVALLLLIPLLAAPALLGAQGSPPAAALDRPGAPEPPSWVSVALAEAAGGTDEGAEVLFAPVTRAILGRLFEAPPVDGCYEVGPTIFERVGVPAPPRSLEQAARQRPILLLGEVVELTPGFSIGTPGTLVRAVAEADSRGLAPGTEVFFFVPVGELVFGGRRICKTDPRYAGLPAVGDEVLVFAERLASLRLLHAPRERPRDLALKHLVAEPATYIPLFPDDLVILPAAPGAAARYPLAWRQEDAEARLLPETPAEVLALLPLPPPSGR